MWWVYEKLVCIFLGLVCLYYKIPCAFPLSTFWMGGVQMLKWEAQLTILVFSGNTIKIFSSFFQKAIDFWWKAPGLPWFIYRGVEGNRTVSIVIYGMWSGSSLLEFCHTKRVLKSYWIQTELKTSCPLLLWEANSLLMRGTYKCESKHYIGILSVL